MRLQMMNFIDFNKKNRTFSKTDTLLYVNFWDFLLELFVNQFYITKKNKFNDANITHSD